MFSIYYKAKNIPFRTLLRSLWKKEGTKELERIYNEQKLSALQAQLGNLPDMLEQQKTKHTQRHREELRKLVEDGKLRLLQIEAESDILKRSLEYEINCLSLKLGIA